MSAPRTVTVQTGDHGPVTLTEPFWCAWTTPGVARRADICHFGEETALVVPTLRGDVRIAGAYLTQWPFAEHDRQVRAAVQFDIEGEYDAARLAGLLDAIVAWAVGPMHSLHEQLLLLEGGDGT